MKLNGTRAERNAAAMEFLPPDCPLDRLLTRYDVMDITGLSRTTIWAATRNKELIVSKGRISPIHLAKWLMGNSNLKNKK